LKGQLKPWAYLPLSDSGTVTGRLENDTLVVYSSDSFAHKTASRPDILQTLSRLASVKAGRIITAVAKQGTPPAQAPASPAAADPFQELLSTGRNLGVKID
jgi:hypothetical protein